MESPINGHLNLNGTMVATEWGCSIVMFDFDRVATE